MLLVILPECDSEAAIGSDNDDDGFGAQKTADFEEFRYLDRSAQQSSSRVWDPPLSVHRPHSFQCFHGLHYPNWGCHFQ